MLTRMTLPRAERTIPQKTGSAKVQLATFFGSLSQVFGEAVMVRAIRGGERSRWRETGGCAPRPPTAERRFHGVGEHLPTGRGAFSHSSVNSAFVIRRRWIHGPASGRPRARSRLAGPSDPRWRATPLSRKERASPLRGSGRPWERGRPARFNHGGPAAHLRAGRPRSQEPARDSTEVRGTASSAPPATVINRKSMACRKYHASRSLLSRRRLRAVPSRRSCSAPHPAIGWGAPA